MSYQETEADRRLANIIRLGVVQALDEGAGTVTVSFGDDIVSEPLPWMTSRAGAGARSWWAPEPGEQVVVVSPSGDISNGVVLPGSVYQDAYGAPAADKNIHRTEYADGSVVQYDRGAHQLLVDVSGSSGNVMIVCQTATVQASGSVTLDTPQTNCTGNLSVAGVMNVDGAGSGGGATSVIRGTVQVIDGDVQADSISLKGHGHIEQGDGARTSNSVA